MDKPDIAELTEVPKHTDDNAVARLSNILCAHRHVDLKDGKLIIWMPKLTFIRLDGTTYRIAAAMCIRQDKLNSGFYGFIPDGKCVVQTSDYEPVIYDSWQEGYRKLIHDIRDYWKQIEHDAQVAAKPYELLYSRLPA